jgi:ribosomal protein L33
MDENGYIEYPNPDTSYRHCSMPDDLILKLELKLESQSITFDSIKKYYLKHRAQIDYCAMEAHEYLVETEEKNELQSLAIKKHNKIIKKITNLHKELQDTYLLSYELPKDVKSRDLFDSFGNIASRIGYADEIRRSQDMLENLVSLLQKKKERLRSSRGAPHKTAKLTNFIKPCIEMYEYLSQKELTLTPHKNETTDGYEFILKCTEAIYTVKSFRNAKQKLKIRKPYTPQEIYTASVKANNLLKKNNQK